MTLELDITYGDAETRGKLRVWKKKLARDFTTFETNYKHAFPLVVDMVRGTTSTREMALQKLSRLFGPGAILERSTLKRNASLVIWSILKPRESVTTNLPDDTPENERASLTQDCVTVNYIVAGCHNQAVIVADGMWSLEVPDHALGRAVERSGFLHPETLIREAHRNLLDLPISGSKEPSRYIKAGKGCFVGGLVAGTDVKVGASVHVRVKTWLEETMLRPDQVPLSAKGEPGRRLGDTILLPRPLWPTNHILAE